MVLSPLHEHFVRERDLMPVSYKLHKWPIAPKIPQEPMLTYSSNCN